jgi:hypothetical protein
LAAAAPDAFGDRARLIERLTAQGPPMTMIPLPPTSTPPTLTIESSGRASRLTSFVRMRDGDDFP